MSRLAQRAAKIEAQLDALSAVTLVVSTGRWHPDGRRVHELTGYFGDEAHAAKAVRRWYVENADSVIKDEHAALLKRYRLTLPLRAQGATSGTQGTSAASGTHQEEGTK